MKAELMIVFVLWSFWWESPRETNPQQGEVMELECEAVQCSKHGKPPFTWMRQETTAEILQTPKDTNGLSTDQI